MKISVIVSTYNGSKYIVEQLDSIRTQTRPADEVIISDDRSSDETPAIVTDYIAKYSLQDKWTFAVNPENKGFIKNFLDGAKRSAGDLILFCDQDDVWENEKIAELEKVIVEYDADAAYCLLTTIDSDGNFVKDGPNRFKKVRGKCEVTKLTIEDRMRSGRSSGLALILKRDLLGEVEKISTKYEIPHDLPVGLIATVNGKYYQLNKALVRHRVHTNNVSSFETGIMDSSKSLNRQIDSRIFKIRELKALLGEYSDKLTDKQRKEAVEAIAMHESAIESLKNRKSGKLIGSLFKSNKMINKLLTMRNIVYVIRKK